MKLKLVWLPGPVHYRCRLFMGSTRETLALCGELTLSPAEASSLRLVIARGESMGEMLTEHALAGLRTAVDLTELDGQAVEELLETGWITPERA